MQVTQNGLIVILVVVATCSFVTTRSVVCQTVAVQTPDKGGNVDGMGRGWPPNTMTAETRRWESLLDRAYPSQFNGTLSGRELVESMNRLGLPVILSGSAKDDSLGEQDQLVLPLSQSSLRTRLLAGIQGKNATICFRHDRIEIISLDDAEDYQYFFTVTYDVTPLVQGHPHELIDSIMQSIDPDSWVDTGQGLATIAAIEINGRHLITVSQGYINHRSVQRFLQGLHRLSRPYQTAPRSSATSVPGGSNAVVLPTRRGK